MDLYLADEDLSVYITDLYMYQKLTTIERALLAKRVPEMLPVILQAFKDEYEPPSEKKVDSRFDTVLGASALNIETEVLHKFQQFGLSQRSYAATASFGAARPQARCAMMMSMPPPPAAPGSAMRHRKSRKCNRDSNNTRELFIHWVK